MTKIFYRTVVAGIPVKVRGTKILEALFKKLGGRIVDAYDKGLVMEFPSPAALAEFSREAKARGAILDSTEEN